MVLPTKTPQGARLNPQNTLELSQGMDIQVAFDTANAHGGEWTILLYPGAPYRQGDITHVGVANITLKSMGPQRALIAPAVAPAAGVIVSGAILTLDGVDVIAPSPAAPALRVTGGTCTCLGHSEFRFVGAGGDAIQQVAGILTFDHCEVLTGDIDLSGGGCTLNMYYCRLVVDPIDTAGAWAHHITLIECDLNGQNINSLATGVTVITIKGCSNIGALTHDGTGAVTLRGSEVASINMTAAGTVVAYGGYIGAITRAVGSVVWWLDGSTIKVLPSATITDGMIGYALAAAAGGKIALRLSVGDYEEDNLAAVDDVEIVGEGHTAASGSHITINSANPIFTCGAVEMAIRHVRITQAGAGAVFVINNAAAVLHGDSLVFGSTAGNAVTMTAGTFSWHHCTSTAGNYDLSTAACALTLHNGSVTGDIVTAGAFAHAVTLTSVDMNNSNITNGATGAGSTTAIIIEKCVAINAFTDASLLGTVLIEATIIASATKTGTSPWTVRIAEFGLMSNENATGAITCYGGVIFAITRAEGPIVWWQDTNTLKVIPCTTTTDTIIGWAIAAAAAAGGVILIHPGTYTEPIACAAGVDLKGVGPASGIIITQVNADIITLATNVHLDNLTIRLGTPDAERHLIEDNAVACTARMTNLILEITVPTNIANLMVFYFTGAGDYTIERCSFSITYTGNAVGHGVHTSTNAATLHLVDNDFTYLANTAAIHIFCSVASTITGSGNTWAGTAIMFETSNGTITLDHDALTCTAGWTVTGTTIVLRHCPIEAPVVAGNLAIVRMKNCSYRAVQRTGTGNIVDESPDLKDAPWHVQRWSWMATLAQSQVSVRGTPLDAGTGQVLLQVVDNVPDVEAVESGTEAAGALSNKLTPARTPRFITQIVVDSFDADVTMFFGLRETLGDAVPAATEDHAGFIWDGANFKSSSDDGIGIQESNLAEPSTDTLHQLEVIVFGGVTTVGWVEFWVDGVLVQTHVTRIPVTDLDWQHLLPTAGGGTGDAIDVTVRGGGVQQCPV